MLFYIVTIILRTNLISGTVRPLSISPRWIQDSKRSKCIVTDRIRSMGEGTVFTGVCHSFCPQKGVSVQRESEGWVSDQRGSGCLVRPGEGRPPPPPQDGYCRGRYASYWNAFLFESISVRY